MTIQGEPFPHELFHCRMSHSGWTHVEVFGGETRVRVDGRPTERVWSAGWGTRSGAQRQQKKRDSEQSKPGECYRKFLDHYDLKLSTDQPLPSHTRMGAWREKMAGSKPPLSRPCSFAVATTLGPKNEYLTFVKELVDWRNRAASGTGQVKGGAGEPAPSCPIDPGSGVHPAGTDGQSISPASLSCTPHMYSVPYEYRAVKR